MGAESVAAERGNVLATSFETGGGAAAVEVDVVVVGLSVKGRKAQPDVGHVWRKDGPLAV